MTNPVSLRSFTACTLLLSFLNNFLHDRPKWSPASLCSATFQSFQGISHLLSAASNFQHHKKLVCIVAHYCTAFSSRRLHCPVTKSRWMCFYLEYTHFEGVLYHSANMLGPGINSLQNISTFWKGQDSVNALHLHMGGRVSLYWVTRIKHGLSNECVMSRQIWPCVDHKHIWGSGGIILLIRNVGYRRDEWWHSSPGRFTLVGRGKRPFIQSKGAAPELVWLLQRSDKSLASAENLTKIPLLQIQ